MTNFVFNPEKHIFVEKFYISTYTTALRIVDAPSLYQVEYSDAFIVDKETRKILGLLSTKMHDFDPRTRERALRLLDPSYKFHDGGITWVDDYGYDQCEPFVLENIPTNAEIWEGRGYTGGHVSQSHWDTDQEKREIYRLVSEGYRVVDKSWQGNVGGYYSRVLFWKDYEQLLRDVRSKSWKGNVPATISKAENEALLIEKKKANIDRFTDTANNLTLQNVMCTE